MTQAIIEGVRKHGYDNYETGGWDYIVECWDSDQITKVYTDLKAKLGREPLLEDVIEDIAITANLLDERRQEIRSEVW